MKSLIRRLFLWALAGELRQLVERLRNELTAAGSLLCKAEEEREVAGKQMAVLRSELDELCNPVHGLPAYRNMTRCPECERDWHGVVPRGSRGSFICNCGEHVEVYENGATALRQRQ